MTDITGCACCRKVIKFPEAEVESQLYCPKYQFILCEACGEIEDKAIDEKGSNDIPELLNTYLYR
jgi:hypothetical protein